MTSEDEDEAAPLGLPVFWVGAEEAAVSAVNQIVLSEDPQSGQFFLTLGCLVPPMIFGSTEERMEQAQRLGYVAVKTVTRVALSGVTLREMRDVLDTVIMASDKQREDLR